MKFLTEDGKIVEGVPLTEKQLKQRKNLITYLHMEFCENKYHYSHGELFPCERMAIEYILGALDTVANKDAEPEEKEVPIPYEYPEDNTLSYSLPSEENKNDPI